MSTGIGEPFTPEPEDAIRRRQPMMPSRMLHVLATGEGHRCKAAIVTEVTPDELRAKVVGWADTSGKTFRWLRDALDIADVIDYGPPYDQVGATFHWPTECPFEWPDW